MSDSVEGKTEPVTSKPSNLSTTQIVVQIKFVNIKWYLSRSKVCETGFVMQYRLRVLVVFR